jgi:hypothetical protein
MGARFYAPSAGAWTSLDTYAGSAANPASMNRFLYVEGNPSSLIDPTGHGVDCEIGQACDPEDRKADAERLRKQQQKARQEKKAKKKNGDHGTSCASSNTCTSPADEHHAPDPAEPPKPVAPTLPTSWAAWDDLDGDEKLAVAQRYGGLLLAMLMAGKVDPHDAMLWLDIADTYHILAIDRDRVPPLSANMFWTDDELTQMAAVLWAEGGDESAVSAMWMTLSTQAAAGLTEGGEADFAGGGLGLAGMGAMAGGVPRPAGIMEGPPSQHIGSVVDDARTGRPSAGHVGGGGFDNDGRSNTTLLPGSDARGEPITYTEFDVNQFVPGQCGRGPRTGCSPVRSRTRRPRPGAPRPRRSRGSGRSS